MDQDKRPINLDLLAFAFPLAALASITHRVAGGVLFFGVGALLYLLDRSLTSAEGFAQLQAELASPAVKVLLWLLVSALLYHLVAGIKHLVLDLGIGETKEGVATLAKIVVGSAAGLILAAGYWIFA